MGRGPARRWALPSAVLLLTAGFLGCGSSPTFTAAGFVDRINQQGVSIELGRRLQAGGGAEEVDAVRLPPLPGEPPPPPGSGPAGARGTLYVFGDDGAAGEKVASCRRGGGLLCYRAANVVIVLGQDSGGLEPARLGVAIKRLAH